MVGLSIVLEAQKSGSVSSKTPQVINKATMMMMMISNKPSSPPSSSSATASLPSYRSCSFPVPAFLEQCFLCGQKLLPGKDIYMYKGDRAFCSVECRCRQIFMDEEETIRKENCSFSAMKPAASAAASSSSSSTKSASTTPAYRHRKTTRNRAGGFAY
ncbi:FCS-Like Zinc finger 15 [Populus alba]|uniref:FLZ-type domain-containing protein n=2 Tax=Populus TaxID=3689 RepID=A0A4U5PMA1_POPAL|nr:FCS-Like Zinc finger 15-like [Populus alba]KAJ6989430.1 FCS-Like Zinc finger 15-like [Populus alba x Populus x berolinensis]TKR98109.1 hypothetical protein D5086_0000206570 [Populus alba]